MTQRGDSSEALSGVVMGKTAGAALAGEGEGESVRSGAVKADGGALVARVLRSQGVEYLFAVNGATLGRSLLRCATMGSNSSTCAMSSHAPTRPTDGREPLEHLAFAVSQPVAD